MDEFKEEHHKFTHGERASKCVDKFSLFLFPFCFMGFTFFYTFKYFQTEIIKNFI